MSTGGIQKVAKKPSSQGKTARSAKTALPSMSVSAPSSSPGTPTTASRRAHKAAVSASKGSAMRRGGTAVSSRAGSDDEGDGDGGSNGSFGGANLAAEFSGDVDARVNELIEQFGEKRASNRVAALRAYVHLLKHRYVSAALASNEESLVSALLQCIRKGASDEVDLAAHALVLTALSTDAGVAERIFGKAQTQLITLARNPGKSITERTAALYALTLLCLLGHLPVSDKYTVLAVCSEVFHTAAFSDVDSARFDADTEAADDTTANEDEEDEDDEEDEEVDDDDDDDDDDGHEDDNSSENEEDSADSDQSDQESSDHATDVNSAVSKRAVERAPLVIEAVNGWNVLVSTLSPERRGGFFLATTLPAFERLLSHTVLGVRTAVGEVIAQLFEAHNSHAECDYSFDFALASAAVNLAASATSSEEASSSAGAAATTGSAAAPLMSAASPDAIDADRVASRLRRLAKDGTRWRARKERVQQRALFRDFVATVEDGDEPSEETLTVGAERHTFGTYPVLVRLHLLRRVLGSGLLLHLAHNPSLAPLVGTDTRVVLETRTREQIRSARADEQAASKGKARERSILHEQKRRGKQAHLTEDM